PNLTISLLSAQIAAAAAFSVVFWIFLFSSHFGRTQPKVGNKFILPAVWLVGVIFSSSPLVYISASQGAEIVNVEAGLAYPVYLALLVILLCVSLWQLIKAGKRASAAEKNQLRFIWWAMALTFGIAIINN